MFYEPLKSLDEVTLEMMEEFLLVCAEIVDERGPIAQPILDRMEKEYLAMKNRGSEADRIRKLLGR
ncbi:hypothetical protein [Shinella zoogloeoides]|uniref:hypothetical protein n=1 Tax=Shinella zoogloeoides TaxID=352475 RepID=UPI00299E958F|nr:hypothetical protein [Shinella zoogloeoides]